jgi:hypothetical protein
MSVPRAFADFTRMRRADLRQKVKAESGYGDEVVDRAIEIAKRNRLINSLLNRERWHKYVNEPVGKF